MNPSKKEVMKRARISKTHFYRLLKGEGSPSRRTAVDLEQASGVAREAWMWPKSLAESVCVQLQ